MAGTLLVAVALLLDGGLPAWPAVFEAASAVATCGFTVRGDAEPGLPGAFVLTAAMLVGASAGSTAGGFKLGRLRRLLRRAAGRDDGGHRLGEPLKRTVQLAVAFAATFLLGTALLWLTAGQPPLRDAAFEAASAIGTVGLSSGLTSADSSSATLLVLTTLMFLGRLEFLVLLRLLCKPLEADG